MKKNNINDIEQQLAPKCEFRASENLLERVMNAAAEETQPSRKVTVDFRWKKAFAYAASVAAIVALFIVVKPVGTPAIAAEKLFARAADYFTTVSGYTVNFEVRTFATEQFSYTNPAKAFVNHTMSVASDGRWKLDKGGRAAEFDGSNIYVWFPDQGWGWKYDPDLTGIIFPFDNLLDLGGMMRWLEDYVASSKGADCRKVEDDRTVKLILKVPAQGDYDNDYMKLSSIGDSDTRQTYVFSKEDGRLLSAEIDARFAGISRTLLRAQSIDYNTAFPATMFTLPANVEWTDHTRQALAAMAIELPIGELAGISAEQAVEKLFKAFNEWDEPMLKAILPAYQLKNLEERGYKGCKLIRKGAAFKSGTYGGLFIPCEIQLADGKKIKRKLALRNDNQWRTWEVDGGI